MAVSQVIIDYGGKHPIIVYYTFKGTYCVNVSIPGLKPELVQPHDLDKVGNFLIEVKRKIPKARKLAYAKQNSDTIVNS